MSRVVIVTGAGQGIGQATVQRFAQQGDHVVIVDIDEKKAQATAASLPAGTTHHVAACDVSDDAGVHALVAQVVARFGRVDVLVNNAGVTRDGLLMRMSDADWDVVLGTNLRGAFLVTKGFTRAFARQRSGRIVNIASVIGLMGNAGQSNYAASKAGLIGFTKSVARELGPRGVTCNAIAPGFIETDMTSVLKEEVRGELLGRIPLGGFGRAEDIAEAVFYLAGPGGRYVTGQVMVVDGGMVM